MACFNVLIPFQFFQVINEREALTSAQLSQQKKLYYQRIELDRLSEQQGITSSYFVFFFCPEVLSSGAEYYIIPWKVCNYIYIILKTSHSTTESLQIRIAIRTRNSIATRLS